MLKQVEYYFLYIFVYAFSLLPFSILLGISRLLSFILKRVAGYRSEVISDNLKKCFPEKSNAEISRIKSRFYNHFAEVMVTSLKLVSLPKKNISRHLNIENPELLESIFENGQSVLLVLGHYANWEWFGPVVYCHPQFLRQGIYRPIKNEATDRIIRKSRGRFVDQLIPQEKVARTLLSQKDKTALTIHIGDQGPSNMDLAIWVDFLGRSTPFSNSMERLAKKTGQQVVFGNMKKLGSGKYSVKYELIEGENITEQYAKKLESQIRNAPAYYLWSHRKWKHEEKAN